MDVTKPYEFTGFGAVDVTKPYEFMWFVFGGGGYCSRVRGGIALIQVPLRSGQDP
jgi:hypothetical protein